MYLSYINTKRDFEHRFFYDLVYEWEDVLCKSFNVSLYYEYRPYLMYRNMRNKYLRRIPILREFLYPHKISLCFDMEPIEKPRFNSKHIIPWIIDFYLPEEKLPQFNIAYREHPLVLISCLDAYNFMNEHKDLCPDVKIEYLPLSLPDQYAFDEKFLKQKKYDVALVGNQEKLLKSFFDRYVAEHPSVTYVYRKNDNGKLGYYLNKGDKQVGGEERIDYINIIRASRVTLYATSMLYGAREGFKNFNHVTPRFLEMIAAGCKALCRYIPNADTRYFELDQFNPTIESYEQFEELMEKALTEPVSAERYKNYLEKHYTSVRAQQLKEILKKYA